MAWPCVARATKSAVMLWSLLKSTTIPIHRRENQHGIKRTSAREIWEGCAARQRGRQFVLRRFGGGWLLRPDYLKYLRCGTNGRTAERGGIRLARLRKSYRARSTQSGRDSA